MRRALAIAVCVLVAAGCRPSPPALVPVKGRVFVNGQPLRGGTIVFAPNEKRGCRGPVSFAVLDSEGAFELLTDNGTGAVAGWHRITIAPPPESTDLIAGLERYRHPELSGLEFEVRTGADNDAIFKLEWEQ